MQHRLSKELIDIIKNNLRDVRFYPGDDKGYLFIVLKKADLKKLSADDIAFLSKYVSDFYRGRYKIRPKSLYHFVSDKKYEEEDEAYFTIPLPDLISAGVLTRRDEGGFSHWTLDGEVLDPKSFVSLYKLDQKLHRTLHSAYGWLDIYDRFADLIEQNRTSIIGSTDYISRFEYRDTLFELKYNGVMYVNKTIKLAEGGQVRVWMNINRPTARDVDRAVEYLEYTEHLVGEIIENMKELVKRSTGHVLADNEFSGFVEIENFSLKEVDIDTHVTLKKTERDSIDLDIKYRFDKRGYEVYRGEDKSSYPRGVITVILGGSITSLYVYKLFSDLLKSEVVRRVLPEDFWISVDRADKVVRLVYEGVYHVDEPTDFAKAFTIIRNFKDVMAIVGEELLNASKNITVAVEERYGHTNIGTVGDILSKIKWRRPLDKDELVLKILALRLLEKRSRDRNERVFLSPPLADYLIGLSVLYGFDQDSLTEKFNDPLETLIEFVNRGMLKIEKVNDMYVKMFKGRPLDEYVDPSIRVGKLEKAIETALAITSSVKEKSTRLATASA